MNRLAKQRRQASSRLSARRDVEEGVLLAGEARRRQVLGGRRGAHREADVLAVLVLQPAVAGEDLGREVVGEAGAVDDLAGALCRGGRDPSTSLGSSPSSAACSGSQAPASSSM